MDIQLTTHFHLSEFTRSETARAKDIDNTPSLEVVSNLQYLCQQVLEPLRQWVGRPIVINSGYRCPQLNQRVGGVKNSQHQTGEAADIRLPDKATGQLYAEFILEHCRFDQLLFESSSKPSGESSSLELSRGTAEVRHSQQNSKGTFWLHVSCKRKGNRQLFRPNVTV